MIEKQLSSLQVKEAVSSPGGTTIKAIHALEKGRLRATIMNAVKAAADQSIKLQSKL
jgi:pyrroline-5-carboxylate reductase